MRREGGIALVYEDGRVIDLPGYGALDHTGAFGDEALRNDIARVRYSEFLGGYKQWLIYGESTWAVNNALRWIVEEKNAGPEDYLIVHTVDRMGNWDTYTGLVGNLLEARFSNPRQEVLPLDSTDASFLRRAMRYFGIEKLSVRDDLEETPDIAVDLGKTPPVILLGRKWYKANRAERQKRLVHECLHVIGLEHNRKLSYDTKPEKDKLSMAVYRDIISGSKSFQPERFGIWLDD